MFQYLLNVTFGLVASKGATESFLPVSATWSAACELREPNHKDNLKMMFLFNGIRAQVEPVPAKAGWYQLTGKHIERWTMDVGDTLGDLENGGAKVDYQAKILGIHDRDAEIAERDPRFNEENNPEDGATFGVYTEAGRTYMLLAVNQAEYALFRFLCPHESGDDDAFDPISDYRLDAAAANATDAA